MRTALKKYLTIFLLFPLTGGCHKNISGINPNQNVLFQLDYENYAWGHIHNGFLIDADGNVLKYANPDSWNHPDSTHVLSSAQMAENIKVCIPSGIKISTEELRKYTGYIKNISMSRVTAMKHVAYDAGSLQFICYLYSEDKLEYKGYIMKMDGDFSCESLNYYSKKTVDWLKGINASLPR